MVFALDHSPVSPGHSQKTPAQRTRPAAGLTPVVMLAVPRVPTADGQNVDSPAPGVAARAEPRLRQAPEYQTVPIIEPDASPLQNLVQNGRQHILNLVGGSRFWRLFVGGGFAVLVGAITLIVLEPRAEMGLSSPNAEPTKSKPAALLPAEGVIADQSQAGRPEIQLVVGETDGAAGQQPAEYMDPFVEANLVKAGVQHAVHHTDATEDPSQLIRQVANQGQAEPAPAWLSGTIETDEGLHQPLRNHERSRPSDR